HGRGRHGQGRGQVREERPEIHMLLGRLHAGRRPEADPHPAHLRFSGMRTTMERIIPQTQDMFDAYGRLNGDNDILHYDPEYARKRGFRGTLGHGLMYLAYVADLAARKYGKDWHYRG